MSKAIFGKTPSGTRLERIKNSPNFKDGQFQNIHHTPQLAEGETYSKVICDFLFAKHPRKTPEEAIPIVKTDLLNLSKEQDILVWFGHSSYFIQLDGKTFLIDPVLSGNASPIKGNTKAFKGADHYKPQDIPEIDFLIITHDHYDHLDYYAVVQLKPKIKKIVCGLGVAAHFEYWGFEVDRINELDWWEKLELQTGFTIHATPARHFSGRGLKRNRSLWVSYVLQTPSMKVFLGGDSGYDTHFKEIGEKYGPFDLAILENGQYNLSWKYIHMQPEETLQAAEDLKAKKLLPVHSCKFSLAPHEWDEPLKRIVKANNNIIPMLTPKIGELVYLKDEEQVFENWWLGIK